MVYGVRMVFSAGREGVAEFKVTPQRRCPSGATENAGMENVGLENVGPNRMGGNCRTGKRRTKIPGVEKAGLENAGTSCVWVAKHNIINVYM